MFNFFSGSWDNRRTTRMVLLAIIVLTLPCYCLGTVLLATAPSSEKPAKRQKDIRSAMASAALGSLRSCQRWSKSVLNMPSAG